MPSEIGKALEGMGSTLNQLRGIPEEVDGPRTRVDLGPSEPQVPDTGGDAARTSQAVADAIAEAESAARPGKPVTGTDPAVDPSNVPPPEQPS